MKLLRYSFIMLLLLSINYKINAQYNWVISNNWTATDLTLDPNPDSNCNTTLFRIVNDTLEMGFMLAPGAGCPYEFKQSPLVNDTMHLRFSWVENPMCNLWEPIHCFTLKLLPCSGFTDIWIQAHFGLFYNDSIPGTWYRVVKSPPCNILAAALPIEKLEWQIDRNNRLINWQTEAEKNISYYEIQKSRDAAEFHTIATVYSQGNGSFKYSTLYDPDFTGRYLYRIKIVSTDNQINYSTVQSDKYDAAYAPIHVFPNPASSELYIDLKDLKNENMDVVIYDMTGNRVNMGRIPVASDNFQYKYDVGGLNTGLYYIYISSLENEFTYQSVLQIKK